MFSSSPYITCALLNGIIPGDFQGDTAVTKIVNIAGNTQRCSGISRIKLIKSLFWRNRTSVANVLWNDLRAALVRLPSRHHQALGRCVACHFGISELFSFLTKAFLSLWKAVKFFSGHRSFSVESSLMCFHGCVYGVSNAWKSLLDDSDVKRTAFLSNVNAWTQLRKLRNLL